MKVKQSSGLTKMGFSKAGFSCCSCWQNCQMGQGDCYHEKEDPEAKEFCQAYQRKHRQNYKKAVLVELSSTGENKVEKNTEIEEAAIQLSLF